MVSAAARYADFRARQRSQTLTAFEAQFDFAFDDFQIFGCRALEDNNAVVVAAPTGSGKTLVGEYALFKALAEGKRAFYTTPIKALSNQKFRDFAARYGRENVGLLTGDVSVNPGAPLVVMTTEVARNMIYRGADLDNLAAVVLDEVHYLADRMRGPVWEEVIIHLPAHITIIALSATVSNAEEFGRWIDSVRGRTQVIISEQRPVPLYPHMAVGEEIIPLFSTPEVGDQGPKKGSRNRLSRQLRALDQDGPRVGRRPNRVGIIHELAAQSMLPAIYFIFSRAACDDALDLCLRARLDLTTNEQKREIEQILDAALYQVPASDWSVLGIDRWREGLIRGIASHHAGLLPLMKEVVEQLFAQGLIAVVFATETLALGINMPARTVVVESLRKFDGIEHVALTPGQFTQLTGRAGRRGIDTVGHSVVPLNPGATPQIVAALISKRSVPLVSAFHPTYNMVANLLGRTSVTNARQVMARSFAQFQADASVVKDNIRLDRYSDELAAIVDQMQCSRGDITTYIAARADLERATAGKPRKIDEQLFASLTPGTVVEAIFGRRTRLAVVTALDPVRARVSAVSDDGAAREFAEGLVGVRGTMTIPPDFNIRKPRQRVALGSQLRQAKRAGEYQLSGLSGHSLEVAKLRDEVHSHPVANCPKLARHLRPLRRYQRLVAKIEREEAHVAARTNSIRNQFDRVCEILTDLGYLADGQPTSAGRTLAHIHAERDLLIAQCLAEGVFAQLTVPALAGALATIIYDSQGPVAPISSRSLRQAVDLIEAHARKINKLEAAAGLELTGQPDPGIAQAAFLWAAGKPLAECLATCELAPGDFVRWMRQLLDLAGQLDNLFEDDRAQELVRAVRRGVVAWT